MQFNTLKAFLGGNAALWELELAIHEKVMVLVPSLPEKEAKVLSLRLGIGAFVKPYTLEEVSDELDISRELVRLLERKALARLLKEMKPEILRHVEQMLTVPNSLAEIRSRVPRKTKGGVL